MGQCVSWVWCVRSGGENFTFLLITYIRKSFDKKKSKVYDFAITPDTSYHDPKTVK